MEMGIQVISVLKVDIMLINNCTTAHALVELGINANNMFINNCKRIPLPAFCSCSGGAVEVQVAHHTTEVARPDRSESSGYHLAPWLMNRLEERHSWTWHSHRRRRNASDWEARGASTGPSWCWAGSRAHLVPLRCFALSLSTISILFSLSESLARLSAMYSSTTPTHALNGQPS